MARSGEIEDYGVPAPDEPDELAEALVQQQERWKAMLLSSSPLDVARGISPTRLARSFHDVADAGFVLQQGTLPPDTGRPA